MSWIARQQPVNESENRPGSAPPPLNLQEMLLSSSETWSGSALQQSAMLERAGGQQSVGTHLPDPVAAAQARLRISRLAASSNWLDGEESTNDVMEAARSAATLQELLANAQISGAKDMQSLHLQALRNVHSPAVTQVMSGRNSPSHHTGSQRFGSSSTAGGLGDMVSRHQSFSSQHATWGGAHPSSGALAGGLQQESTPNASTQQLELLMQSFSPKVSVSGGGAGSGYNSQLHGPSSGALGGPDVDASSMHAVSGIAQLDALLGMGGSGPAGLGSGNLTPRSSITSLAPLLEATGLVGSPATRSSPLSQSFTLGCRDPRAALLGNSIAGSGRHRAPPSKLRHGSTVDPADLAQQLRPGTPGAVCTSSSVQSALHSGVDGSAGGAGGPVSKVLALDAATVHASSAEQASGPSGQAPGLSVDATTLLQAAAAAHHQQQHLGGSHGGGVVGGVSNASSGGVVGVPSGVHHQQHQQQQHQQVAAAAAAAAQQVVQQQQLQQAMYMAMYGYGSVPGQSTPAYSMPGTNPALLAQAGFPGVPAPGYSMDGAGGMGLMDPSALMQSGMVPLPGGFPMPQAAGLGFPPVSPAEYAAYYQTFMENQAAMAAAAMGMAPMPNMGMPPQGAADMAAFGIPGAGRMGNGMDQIMGMNMGGRMGGVRGSGGGGMQPMMYGASSGGGARHDNQDPLLGLVERMQQMGHSPGMLGGQPGMQQGRRVSRRDGEGIPGSGSGGGSGRLVNSTLLEEFKANKTRKFEFADILGHVFEFSLDQHGSRFIQQKLEVAPSEELTAALNEVLPRLLVLMNDVFGNFVVQKFLEHGKAEQRLQVADTMKSQVLQLSLQMYGCRVVQKALEVLPTDMQCALIAELDGNVMRCVRDQNGNHVIQKIIECVPTPRITALLDNFLPCVVPLSCHPFGCRVIQRILEHCSDAGRRSIVMDEILRSSHALAQDQYGNYVVQHVLEHGAPEHRSHIVGVLAPHVVALSMHKFASNVVEACLTHCTVTERDGMVRTILGTGHVPGLSEGGDGNEVVPGDVSASGSDGGTTSLNEEALTQMMKDQFGNYVVQKVLEVCDDYQRDHLLNRVRAQLHVLKKYTYGKHIVARVEKLLSAGTKIQTHLRTRPLPNDVASLTSLAVPTSIVPGMMPAVVSSSGAFEPPTDAPVVSGGLDMGTMPVASDSLGGMTTPQPQSVGGSPAPSGSTAALASSQASPGDEEQQSGSTGDATAAVVRITERPSTGKDAAPRATDLLEAVAPAAVQ